MTSTPMTHSVALTPLTYRVFGLTVKEFLQLDKITLSEIVAYCMINFDEDWSIIPPRFRTYKSYRYALRRTIPLWMSIDPTVRKMSVLEETNRIEGLSDKSSSPLKSFILAISLYERQCIIPADPADPAFFDSLTSAA